MIARRRALLAQNTNAVLNGNASAAQNAKTLAVQDGSAFVASTGNAAAQNDNASAQNAKTLAAQNGSAFMAWTGNALPVQNGSASSMQNGNAFMAWTGNALPVQNGSASSMQNGNAFMALNGNAPTVSHSNPLTPIQAKASENHVSLPAALSLPENLYRGGSLALPLPKGWSPATNTKGSSTFRIVAPDGMPAGNATLSVVAITPANINPPIGREQRRMLGGVSFTELRRNVIDRMFSAGGWVVNDREREIGGHRVFQVIAQTPGANPGAPEQIWNFYFTEMNGRVYSLTTRTAVDLSDKLTADAEKFLSSFNPMPSPSPIKK